MIEKYNFVGKNLDQEEKEKGVGNLQRHFVDNNLFRDKNELKKTKEETSMIETATALINKELITLGLSEVRIPLGQVHLFDREEFKKRQVKNNFDATSDIQGTYSSVDSKIEIMTERSSDKFTFLKKIISGLLNKHQELVNKESFLNVFTHESVHNDSFQSFHIDKDSNQFGPYRTGYTVQSHFNDDYPHEHFRGFNEAIVELTTHNILKNNTKDLQTTFNIDGKKLDDMFFTYAYLFQKTILLDVIEGMSKKYHKPQMEIWETIEKGQFTGNMMHLRNIEKTFGPGSLRILASIGADAPSEEIQSQYNAYFKAAKPMERRQIAKNIVKTWPAEEQKAYEQHVNSMRDR